MDSTPTTPLPTDADPTATNDHPPAADHSAATVNGGPAAAAAAGPRPDRETRPTDVDGQTRDEPRTATIGRPAPDRLSARLVRPRPGRMIAGVCAGMAAAWRVDAVVLRLLFVALVVFTFPLGGLFYILCWILMPQQDDQARPTSAGSTTDTP